MLQTNVYIVTKVWGQEPKGIWECTIKPKKMRKYSRHAENLIAKLLTEW